MKGVIWEKVINYRKVIEIFNSSNNVEVSEEDDSLRIIGTFKANTL